MPVFAAINLVVSFIEFSYFRDIRWCRKLCWRASEGWEVCLICKSVNGDLLQVGGQYVAYRKVRKSSEASCNVTLADGLWQASARLTGNDEEEEF